MAHSHPQFVHRSGGFNGHRARVPGPSTPAAPFGDKWARPCGRPAPTGAPFGDKWGNPVDDRRPRVRHSATNGGTRWTTGAHGCAIRRQMGGTRSGGTRETGGTPSWNQPGLPGWFQLGFFCAATWRRSRRPRPRRRSLWRDVSRDADELALASRGRAVSAVVVVTVVAVSTRTGRVASVLLVFGRLDGEPR